jgi:hypothetical protein
VRAACRRFGLGSLRTNGLLLEPNVPPKRQLRSSALPHSKTRRLSRESKWKFNWQFSSPFSEFQPAVRIKCPNSACAADLETDRREGELISCPFCQHEFLANRPLHQTLQMTPPTPLQGVLAFGLIAGLLFLLVLLKVFVPAEVAADGGTTPTHSTSETPRPLEHLEITSSSYSISRSFGVSVNADILVRNTGQRTIKDPTFAVACFGKSGTAIGVKSQTIYEVIEPGTKRWFKPKFYFCPEQTDTVTIALANAQWR